MECPICGKETKEGQRYCISCGRDLTKPVTWHCAECFGDVTSYDREIMEFCPHCRAPIEGGRFLSDEEVPQAKKLKALR